MILQDQRQIYTSGACQYLSNRISLIRLQASKVIRATFSPSITMQLSPLRCIATRDSTMWTVDTQYAATVCRKFLPRWKSTSSSTMYPVSAWASCGEDLHCCPTRSDPKVDETHEIHSGWATSRCTGHPMSHRLSCK